MGQVYAAHDGENVVKLYRSPPASLKQSLQHIVDVYKGIRAEVDWAPLFCWPTDIVLHPRLGVRMPRIPDGFDELAWLINPKALATKDIGWHSWHLRFQVALSLAMAMQRLHGDGLAHSDLSPRNVWFNPRDGRITLIDIDGLVVPSVNPPQVIGTPEYIAPEIVANSRLSPSIKTDRHSLAVLLYQLLLYRHPLHGPQPIPDGADYEQVALGPDGIYIDHPTDDTNRPTKHLWESFWPSQVLGPQLASLFERSFVAGLRDPSARPVAGEWLGALTRLADRVVACANRSCHERYFPLADGMPPMCPWCRTLVALPADLPMLHLYVSSPSGSHYAPEPNAPWWIVAAPGRKLYEWHASARVNATPNGLGQAAVAEVELSSGVWQLRNDGLPELKCVRADGSTKAVAVGARVRLERGVYLVLGRGRALVVGEFEQ
jgi:DNA-binding helix-hairpin-helix protein with protein kinase domain